MSLVYFNLFPSYPINVLPTTKTICRLAFNYLAIYCPPPQPLVMPPIKREQELHENWWKLTGGYYYSRSRNSYQNLTSSKLMRVEWILSREEQKLSSTLVKILNQLKVDPMGVGGETGAIVTALIKSHRRLTNALEACSRTILLQGSKCPWMSLNLKTKIQGLECLGIYKEIRGSPWFLLVQFGYFLKLFDSQNRHFVELTLHVHIWQSCLKFIKVAFWQFQRHILLISNAFSSVFSPWICWYTWPWMPLESPWIWLWLVRTVLLVYNKLRFIVFFSFCFIL